MTLVPLIARELQATARQPFTYTLRVLGVTAIMAACGAAAMDAFFYTRGGGRVFAYLHFTFFCVTWILAPLLTADCLSKERREGTLPLLFLAPLQPRGIVLAKGMAHGLRGLSLWLAVFPTMCIPFLLGGVGWKEALLSAIINFSSLVLALAAGLLASAFCRRWRTSIFVGLVTSSLFAGAFAVLSGLAMIGATYRYIPGAGRAMIWRSFEMVVYTALLLVGDFESSWSEIFSRFAPAAQWSCMAANAAVLVLSLGAAWIVVWIAGKRLEKTWREEPASARTERITKALTRPVIGVGLFKRWLNSHLARNPVGWLEQRRPGGRLVAWFWLAAVVLIYGAYGFGQDLRTEDFVRLQEQLAWLLLGSIVLTSAGSFRRERENGVLELLLVSPMSEWKMISGRLWALWKQFLPAMLILAAGIIFETSTFRSEEAPWFLPYFGLGYLTLPVIGLYFSLARKQFIASVLWTILFGSTSPLILAISSDYDNPAKDFFFAVVLQSALAATFALILKNHLARRKFALELE